MEIHVTSEGKNYCVKGLCYSTALSDFRNLEKKAA